MNELPFRIVDDTDHHVQFSRRVTDVKVQIGLPENADDLWEEISGYIDILLGRVDPPVTSPYLTLQELATAYYGRALEIDALIHRGERLGVLVKGGQFYKFRTGELDSFINLARKAADLGSRRLSQEQLLQDQRHSI